MSLSPDPPLSKLSYLYQQQRNPAKTTLDTTHPRGRNASNHELGRRHRHGERVTRIYPREIAKPPRSAQRYSSTSPSSPPTYNAGPSPLLSALGATKTTATHYTSEWTKSLPFFGNNASPGQGGIPISGSPPVFHNSPGARDPVYGHAAMSNSPPAPAMRPLSHPNHHTTFGGRLQGSPHELPGRDRRASMYSQVGQRGPFSNNPPLPHQPQSHYYNLPDFNLGLNDDLAEGITAGEGGYHCGFDSLAMAGDDAARTAENVLVVGYQGGVDLFRVERSRLDLVGGLEGLRGSVIGAKILPWTARRDPLADSRPLIALVLHGPVLQQPRRAHSGSTTSSVIDDGSSDSPSRPPSSRGNDQGNTVTHYQTTVEVFSLKERKQIAVLYKSPLIPVSSPVDSPMFEPPAPAGEFVLEAKGKFVVVASGTSGEVFIFAPYLRGHEDYVPKFRCVGKVWTTVLRREKGLHSSSSSAADGSSDEAQHETRGTPLFSVSERWLAVTPPAASVLLPVNGVALTSPYYEKPPGLSHHTVPPQPSPNCAVDAPEAGSLIDRLTREGTQVAIKGARWATEKGIQAFKSYMNKGSQPNNNAIGYHHGPDPMEQPYFPPTHGQNQVQRQEATVISIYDLQRLLDAEETGSKTAVHPLATIPAALGCSFLSFAPTGLFLMTVSAKGDVQTVWDLKRITSRKARKTSREQIVGPHVRQIARFTRLTVANVVDVVWSQPRPDRVAVITDKGTIHMFPMPASAFQWPPPRRTVKPSPPAKIKEEGTATNERGGAISSAMQALNGSAKPLFDAVRARGTSNGSRFPSFSSLGLTPASGAKSGKAVAAGVGKSINNIRHSGDNKLWLSPISSSGAKLNSVRWLTGKGRGSIAFVSAGVLQIYKVHMRPATGRGKSATAPSISKTKLAEFGLSPVSAARFPPSVAAFLAHQEEEPRVPLEPYGDWLPRALPNRGGKGRSTVKKHVVSSPAPLSFSEIETNPPYQPFYTDRRVTRFKFARQRLDASTESEQLPTISELSSDLHHADEDTPWLFGEEVEAVRIASPASYAYDVGQGGDEDDDSVIRLGARIETKLSMGDGEEEVEQVVSTTRRRRVKAGEGPEDDDGFFEDDCEVLDFAEDRV
ncbi:uncharacterized protein EI97DRAFT_419437 [Westerdykella ornata]|uniref:BCAS3 domain-containing protein n=1 Tax=Westerdykella ornata TaxID=318751 RepID=A0A6A6JLP9_WESOR|nr:uncharacterized protein EI97DRAFT_419437 [Westerdykella ornata]KAF2275839.1 hypothetical protein EI97DRAFT_419437 [Westerdykella ornata]